MTQRMFSFITRNLHPPRPDTTNPIAGGPCPYACQYPCWAGELKARHKMKKYTGPYHLDESELHLYPAGSFPFVDDMSDIGDPDILNDIIMRVLAWINSQPLSSFLLLTKNPDFFIRYSDAIPRNAVLGATIETDDGNLISKVSKAPDPITRFHILQRINHTLPNRVLVVAEPVMEFTRTYLEELRAFPHLWGFAIGYNNYGKTLEEPSLADTTDLINEAKKFTTVYTKTLRERWM